ncbi:MAG TPA: serine/threonine-protein kinase [Acidobacteriota bacterium]|nr:serine/threonine-protein kinase [Acidobacteriota bacterium]
MNASSATLAQSSPVADSLATSCKFCPTGGMLPEDFDAKLGAIDGKAVRTVLTVLSPLLLFVGIGYLASAWGEISAGLLAAQIAMLVLLGVSAAVVYSGLELTYRRLRLLELGVFLSGMILISLHAFSDAAAGSPQSYHYAVIGSILLAVSYGVFVPNPYQRTLLVAAVLLSVPFFCGLVLSSQPAWRGSSLSLWIPIALLLPAWGVAVGASALVDRYRRTSNEGKEADLYHLKKKIGGGGMGEVWLAEHKMLARPSAMKMIHPDKLKGEDPDGVRRARDRFQREAKVTASLRSPHTVELYDFGITADGTFFYVMELLDGFDLDTLVKRYGPQPSERVVHLLLQVCDSLGDAHANGLVHRDIKPANIYVTRMGLARDFVKVLDFGLVKNIDPTLGQNSLTIDGVTTGTPAFMAPEMARGKGQVDHRTDLYALGCVAYWLLTGQLVFDSENPLSIVVDHVNSQPAPPSSRSELEIPGELDAAILRCLAKAPEERFQSAGELAEALASIPLKSHWDSARAAKWWELHQPESSRPAA